MRRGPTQQGVDVRGGRAVAAPDHMRMEPELVPEPDRGRPRDGGGIGIGPSRGGGVTAHGRPPFRSGPVSLKAGILVGVRGQRRVPRAQLARAVVVDDEARLLCGGEARALHEDRPGAVRGHHDGLAVPDLRRGVLHPVPGEDRARLVDDTRPGGPDAAERGLQEVDAAGRMRPGVVGERGQRVKGHDLDRDAVSAIGVGAASAPAGAVSRSRVPVGPS